MSRSNLVIAVTGLLSAALLFLVPPIGAIAILVWLVIAPPWGRTLAERAIISTLVLLGAMAVIVPGAGSTPVTPVTADLLLVLVAAAALILRFIPRLGRAPIPRPRAIDGFLLLLALGTWWWLAGPYLGVDAIGTINGLFFSGWDNHGHYTAFANTYTAASTTWPTASGTIAWNQWYPSLHSTAWALGQMALTGSGGLTRVALLEPYLQWSAASFALCAAAFAWMSSDIASRLARGSAKRLAPWLAAGATGALMLLGSPALLFNSGFTNYLMAVTVAAVASYLGARNWRSARTIGWYLVPLSALIVSALWTPLVIAFALPGLVVMIALWRMRWWLGIAWGVASGLLVGGTVWRQSRAILTAGGSTEASGTFAQDLGSVGVGMTPFNLSAAVAFAAVALLVAVYLFMSRRRPIAAAVLGPTLGILVVLTLAISAADSASITRLISYYVLKTLNALLLANAPLVAAILGVAVAALAVTARNRLSPRAGRAAGAGIVVGATVLGLASFGYLGVVPERFPEGVQIAPGLAARSARVAAINDNLIGEALINAAEAAGSPGTRTTVLWDGSGTLPNLWVSSLTGVLSLNASQFYGDLPAFPYDQATVDYLNLALNTNSDLELEVLWFREPSGVLLQQLRQGHADRVDLVQVPMSPTALCPECTGAVS